MGIAKNYRVGSGIGYPSGTAWERLDFAFSTLKEPSLRLEGLSCHPERSNFIKRFLNPVMIVDTQDLALLAISHFFISYQGGRGKAIVNELLTWEKVK